MIKKTQIYCDFRNPFLICDLVSFLRMCGITGVFLADSNQSANTDLFEGLGLLQHRGQVDNDCSRGNNTYEHIGCCWNYYMRSAWQNVPM